jgi:hypothetical protein
MPYCIIASVATDSAGQTDMTALFSTADAAEGVASFIERREARFQGS